MIYLTLRVVLYDFDKIREKEKIIDHFALTI